MDTLEEIKNCPLHTSDMTSRFVSSKSRDGEAFWFKSPTSCSWLNEWPVSISLAPSISKAILLIQQLETCRLYLQEAATPLSSCSQTISISLAPSISKTVFVDSTTWNLSLVPLRSCDPSSILFSRSFCNHKITSLEEIKNYPLHTSNMASRFVCSKSRYGEAFWFKSPTSCSWPNEWPISILLAPSIS